MFNTVYPCSFKMHKPVNDGVHIRTHVYTFKANNHQTYIVEFDEFIGSIYLVKFHQKNHSNSKHKYNLLTNSGWASSVIYTVFNLMVSTLTDNKFNNPSFAFMGSNIVYTDGKQPESKEETKRFKFYKTLIATFIGPKSFTFKQNKESSIFVLLNNKNSEVKKHLDEVLKYIYLNYAILDIDLILEPIELGSQSG